MLKEYDIDKLNPRPNPYAKKLKKQITINLTSSTVDYFKAQASQVGIPYQTLIDMYLTDCAESNRKLHLKWDSQVIIWLTLFSYVWRSCHYPVSLSHFDPFSQKIIFSDQSGSASYESHFSDSAVAGTCTAWYNCSVGMFCIINGGALWQAKNAQATIRS